MSISGGESTIAANAAKSAGRKRTPSRARLLKVAMYLSAPASAMLLRQISLLGARVIRCEPTGRTPAGETRLTLQTNYAVLEHLAEQLNLWPSHYVGGRYPIYFPATRPSRIKGADMDRVRRMWA